MSKNDTTQLKMSKSEWKSQKASVHIKLQVNYQNASKFNIMSVKVKLQRNASEPVSEKFQS